MNIKASVTLVASAKIQKLCTLVRGEVLRQFDTFSDEVVSISSEHLKVHYFGFWNKSVRYSAE